MPRQRENQVKTWHVVREAETREREGQCTSGTETQWRLQGQLHPTTLESQTAASGESRDTGARERTRGDHGRTEKTAWNDADGGNDTAREKVFAHERELQQDGAVW
ncbi:hypothetical protein B0H11DRAFT_1915114 [Mycena galericulata]|nr:hypothetical protein B0H11DRAFT_1915114 [Mycena galericulata]